MNVEMVRGKCAKCAHVYDVVAGVMPLTVLAKALADRSTCPICGNRERNALDTPRDLTRDERERHAQAMGNMKRLDFEGEGSGQ